MAPKHCCGPQALLFSASEIKCARIKNEAYGKKSSISSKNIEESKKWLKMRWGLQDFAGNYSHDKRFAKQKLALCKTDQEEKGHIVAGRCEVYEDLRTQFGDLREAQNLVKYFQAVLDRRDCLEEEDSMRQSSTASVVARPVSVSGDRTNPLS